jgi:6-phosphogluconolactonase
MKSEFSFTRWWRYDSAEEVAQAAVAHILQAARQAIAQRGVCRIVLAGGRTPELAYRMLAQQAEDWQHWHVYFGDERCLPPEHPERNSVMARQAWLEPAGIAHVYPIAAELGASAAARRYAELIQPALPFDIVILGLGEDGHAASLFPGHAHDPAQAVHAVFNAPKPPPDRVSLSAASLANTRKLLVLVSGAGKREAVQRWRDAEALPITQIQPMAGVEVLIDAAAWGE